MNITNAHRAKVQKKFERETAIITAYRKKQRVHSFIYGACTCLLGVGIVYLMLSLA